jgi:hypothetical protein
MGLTSGNMPDITPPQIAALLVGGIPLIAELLRGFGVYDLSLEQQAALSNVVTWAGVLAAALIGGDALLRVGRNLRRGQVEAAEVVSNVTTPSVLPPEGGTTYHPSTQGFEEPPPKV